MEFNWGIFIFTIIGIAVFSIPAAIKFTKWLRQRRTRESGG
jgi:hypothetical protein